jgi:hypothetical protein
LLHVLTNILQLVIADTSAKPAEVSLATLPGISRHTLEYIAFG